MREDERYDGEDDDKAGAEEEDGIVDVESQHFDIVLAHLVIGRVLGRQLSIYVSLYLGLAHLRNLPSSEYR